MNKEFLRQGVEKLKYSKGKSSAREQTFNLVNILLINSKAAAAKVRYGRTWNEKPKKHPR